MVSRTYYPFTTLPAALDVVWCRFPFDEHSPNYPGPKPRPALVLASALSGKGEPEVKVMYGTSKFDHKLHKYDMFVAKLADMNEAGLSQATRFRFDRWLWLPWCEEFFEARKGYPTPVIGSLRAIQALPAHAWSHAQANESSAPIRGRAGHGVEAPPAPLDFFNLSWNPAAGD